VINCTHRLRKGGGELITNFLLGQQKVNIRNIDALFACWIVGHEKNIEYRKNGRKETLKSGNYRKNIVNEPCW